MVLELLQHPKLANGPENDNYQNKENYKMLETGGSLLSNMFSM